MKNFISVHNVPVSLETRLLSQETNYIVYVNCYSWIVNIDGYYEFYYTPNHFIGKIAVDQIPRIVIDRIKSSYKVINQEITGHGRTQEYLKPSSIRFRRLETDMRIGTWYYAQGQNYATFDNTFVCDDMYVENCERECPFSEIDGTIIHDMLRMNCQTRTPYYYKGIFDFPCFYNVNTRDIVIYPFNGLKWDADYWMSDFKSLTHYIQVHGDKHVADEIHDMRADVFKHTVCVVSQGYYETESGIKVEIPNDNEMIKNTVFYSDEIDTIKTTKNYLTEISVENMDCLNVAEILQKEGYNVAVLNMASRQNPGGGVYAGAGAQEENLFRRTNLYRSMFQYAGYADQYGLSKSFHQYPLDRNFGGIYTPNAFVFRDTEDNGYKLLDIPYHMSFIAVPGMNRPDLTDEGMIADHLIEPIKNKMRTIFRIGLVHKHDALVLGAFGCGAFRNPPIHIAKLFHEVLNEEEFKNKYRKIVFAILEDHNSHHTHNPEGNFKPFFDEFNS